MYCYKCGKEIPNDAAFCGHCGTKVANENNISINQQTETEKKFDLDKVEKKALKLALISLLANLLLPLAIIADHRDTFFVFYYSKQIELYVSACEFMGCFVFMLIAHIIIIFSLLKKFKAGYVWTSAINAGLAYVILFEVMDMSPVFKVDIIPISIIVYLVIATILFVYLYRKNPYYGNIYSEWYKHKKNKK